LLLIEVGDLQARIRFQERETRRAVLTRGTLVEGRLPLAGFGAAHDEGQRGKAGDDDGHDPKATYKAERVGLRLHRLVGKGERFLSRPHGVTALRHKNRLQALQPLLKIRIAMAGVRRKVHLMNLILPRQEHRKQRSSNAAAEVAGKIGEPGNLVVLLSMHAAPPGA